ncbi:MAG TPA: thiamine diphosphokinase [Anaerolineaceae bacterium]|jgi:thiamine pyrophosphokinase|nr:thiamine diphosphokinase [Anaerolineaceae bacterium]HPA32136.1 thiamine diphosphokinase [Anaerolineaceae bacterium]HQF45245.1 thiamine diphosphokinase [Anaerolineaceae bacterium]HQH35027.1 thiamine diphosphokinase [Anaerolineaceae bacterium]HQJ02406.1 thiamine diphosphokinase [Anaerolineaceae bacterium]
MNDFKHATLFVNGQLEDPGALRLILKPASLWIAVDGGLTHLRRLGLEPDVVIGDLDSVEPGDLTYLEPFGIKVLQYPPAKDETDLELAIQYALEQGCQSICIVAGLGGRLDHTLGNLFLLLNPRLADIDIRLDDGLVEAFLIRREATIQGAEGDLVSLVPLEGSATGICTEGLQYPLKDETLVSHQTRGISNRMLGSSARVELREGKLLCIHTRQNISTGGRE